MDSDFSERIKLEDLDSYRKIIKEIPRLEANIRRHKMELEQLPSIKSRARSSMYEFPYVETHVTIDAPDPKRKARLERLIRHEQIRLAGFKKIKLDVEEFIFEISDSRTRQIFDAVFVKGRSRTAVAVEFGVTHGRISQLINEEVSRQIKNQKNSDR